jgi:hypothetical protein
MMGGKGSLGYRRYSRCTGTETQAKSIKLAYHRVSSCVRRGKQRRGFVAAVIAHHALDVAEVPSTTPDACVPMPESDSFIHAQNHRTFRRIQIQP